MVIPEPVELLLLRDEIGARQTLVLSLMNTLQTGSALGNVECISSSRNVELKNLRCTCLLSRKRVTPTQEIVFVA